MAQKARRPARNTARSTVARGAPSRPDRTASTNATGTAAASLRSNAASTPNLGELLPAEPVGGWGRRAWRTLRGIHPGLVLAFLDTVGLAIATYLSTVELQNELPICPAFLSGCEDVARSQYSRIGGIPVAVFGVFLSATLLILALAWWRTNRWELLLAHYLISLVGVIFEGYFQIAQFFWIQKFCIWCETYGISLILRFVIAAWVYFRTPKPNATVPASARGKTP